MVDLAVVWGQRLRTAREAAGLTQVVLAERCGVEQQMVSYWELGHGAPRDRTRLRVAEALGVSVNELFAYPEDGEETAPDNGDTEAA